VEFLACDASSHVSSRPQDASTMVELGKQLLHSAKNGDTDAVRELMCRGAPFTTDWVCILAFKKYSYFVNFWCNPFNAASGFKHLTDHLEQRILLIDQLKNASKYCIK
jgi:hypothetical protein